MRSEEKSLRRRVRERDSVIVGRGRGLRDLGSRLRTGHPPREPSVTDKVNVLVRGTARRARRATVEPPQVPSEGAPAGVCELGAG